MNYKVVISIDSRLAFSQDNKIKRLMGSQGMKYVHEIINVINRSILNPGGSNDPCRIYEITHRSTIEAMSWQMIFSHGNEQNRWFKKALKHAEVIWIKVQPDFDSRIVKEGSVVKEEKIVYVRCQVEFRLKGKVFGYIKAAFGELGTGSANMSFVAEFINLKT